MIKVKDLSTTGIGTIYYINGSSTNCLGSINTQGNIQDQAAKIIKALPFDWKMIKEYETAKEEIVKQLYQLCKR